MEARAQACICLEGDSRLISPAVAEHPVGAPFVLASECPGGLARWTATIDGVPVALVGSGVDDGLGPVTLASTPTEGTEVVLTHACGEYTDAVDCIDGYLERITTTIGPADVAAPPPVAALAVDHEIGMLADKCGDPEVYALRIDATLEIGDREPGSWAVLRAVVDDDVIASQERVLGELGTLQSGLFVVDPDEHAGRDVCVEVQVVDASGDASDTTRECTANRARELGVCDHGASACARAAAAPPRHARERLSAVRP